MTFAAPFQRPGVKPSYVRRDGLVFWEGSMIVDVHIHSRRYPDHFIKEIFLLSNLPDDEGSQLYAACIDARNDCRGLPWA